MPQNDIPQVCDHEDSSIVAAIVSTMLNIKRKFCFIAQLVHLVISFIVLLHILCVGLQGKLIII